MRQAGRLKAALFLAACTLFGMFAFLPPAHAVETYKATAFPFYAQEGSTITLILSVSGATPSTTYGFVFNVTEPNSVACTSSLMQHTTAVGETEFGIILPFPGPQFTSSSCTQTSIVGYYHVVINQVLPVVKRDVTPGVYFAIGITDKGTYQRTTTVSIIAVGYKVSEPVSVVIRTTSSLTVVFSDSVLADSTGRVTDSWKVPRNATTTEQYLVTVTGSSTSKNPSDAEIIYVIPAVVSIVGFAPSSPSYQRTQVMDYSFQATYPSGEFANTGVAVVTLTRPDRANITLTATYDPIRQQYVAQYKTFATNQTGTWTASLQTNAFDDGWGNAGPSSPVPTSTQLSPATLAISISIKPYFVVNEQITFNATILYPDGSSLTTGSVYAYLSFSGGGYNYSIPVSYDSALGVWAGAYSPNNAPGGLWSLKVSALDSAVPANTGSSTRNITLEDRPPIASFTESSTQVLTIVNVYFNASTSYDPDGSIIAYNWNFGDTSTGSGRTTSHSYATAGTYTVKLNVTDNSGSTAVSSVVITVNDRPPIPLFTPSANSGSTGTIFTFNAAASSDPDGIILTYSWNFGDGSSGSGINPSHSYSIAGSYTVTLTANDNSGSTATITSAITVMDRPPAATFSISSTTPNPGTPVSFSAAAANDPDGSITSYAWSFGDGSSGSGVNPTHTYSSAGTYTVKLTVTDNNNSTAVSSQTVTVGGGSSSNQTTSTPLYLFGILVAVIAGMLAGGFLYFRRHRVTHANLKLDLEAVKSEAGRIESQEFFQSVKDQLRKDREDQQ